jgi:Trk K+ transport system NAD-binding subunit
MWVRTTLAVRQNRLALGFVFAWLAGNYAAFVQSFGMTKTAAALVTFCITKAGGGWASAYQSFTEVVVFGVVASLVLTNLTRHYNPQATCRALAARAKDHVIVIGYTNLGKRVHELVSQSDKSVVVVVEEDAAEVDDLVRDEAPLVVGSPRDRGVLEDAGVARAKVVVLATDDLEAAAVACRLVREANASCELVVRCPDDDAGAVLARTYRARAVSTSKLAGAYVLQLATNARSKAVVVMGKNSVGHRVAEALAHKRIPTSFVDVTEDPRALEAAGVAQADMVVVCDDDLGKNLIRVDRIRDLNKRARIVCRAFHDDAAEILRRPPFECTVLSTSRHAAHALVKAGAFREIGLDEAPAKLVVPELAPVG